MDKSELNISIFKEDQQGEVMEGLMTCEECSRYYPIIYGIPIMTPDEYREKALEAPILQRWGLETNLDQPQSFSLENQSMKALEETKDVN